MPFKPNELVIIKNMQRVFRRYLAADGCIVFRPDARTFMTVRPAGLMTEADKALFLSHKHLVGETVRRMKSSENRQLAREAKRDSELERMKQNPPAPRFRHQPQPKVPTPPDEDGEQPAGV